MRACFPAPAVISGASSSTITQIALVGRRRKGSFEFSAKTRRRQCVWLPERSKQIGGRRAGIGLQCKCSYESRGEDNEWVVVNFYHFVMIKDAEAEAAKHLSFVEGLNIRGRIYLNEQGIMHRYLLLSYSGLSRAALAYFEWLRGNERFSGILVQVSAATSGHCEGGISHLPLLDPSMRRLEAVNTTSDASNDNLKRNHILLEVRNGYEWDVGHFEGARRPDMDCFRMLIQVIAADPLGNVDKEKTDILMYCTGGIRCNVYSTILRQKGFQHLYTLKQGVYHYLENKGPVQWIGNLFVFDSPYEDPENNTFARCYTCGSLVCELRHRNCANLECNLLCCLNRVKDLRGRCCSNCTTAPRLRAVLPRFQRDKKWHTYQDSIPQSQLMA
ncbi:rhodanese-like domain-containing protein 8 [Pyrus ussuriensis x Pyrus communis]|uniref:Rhodanese-like domain-containing protein 8 n=1 Tax=Pyrus ussuriensis x Pyrus communis TaxID=2448454 RepID=A0A5N5IEJ4_9ROSA|nr:rhodanese-like domain-containing protein 8 [Pyrus ussuriensis x Pyrus communis]